MKKVDCILLVDDDEFDNYFHESNIRKAGVCNHIHIVYDGESALEYINKSLNGNAGYPKPDIIYLDINMPRMNGFEFIDEFRNLDEKFRSGIAIIILSTSGNPRDVSAAMSYNEVKEFQNKPLTVEMIHETVEKYF